MVWPFDDLLEIPSGIRGSPQNLSHGPMMEDDTHLPRRNLTRSV